MELDEESQRWREYGFVSSERAASPPSFGGERSLFGDLEQDETTSIAESGTSYGQAGRTKRLTIRRMVRNAFGQEEERSEVVTDMRVINAYLRQRAIIEHEETTSGEIYPGIGGEEEKRRKKRRVQEHVNKMKEDRKGKRRRGAGSDEEQERRHEPLTLKIRTPSLLLAAATAAAASSTPPLKKRQSISATDTDYLQPVHPKSYGRRRAAPEVDLASILGRVITELIAIPEAYEFCRPVSAVAVPDYYDIVKKPKTLEQIRDDVRDYRYKTAAAFLDDLELVAYNARIYNGTMHPLTTIAEGLVTRARGQLDQQREELGRIEQELAESEAVGLLSKRAHSLGHGSHVAVMVQQAGPPPAPPPPLPVVQ
ncbi:uncharacterized protein SPPG_05568 [Spizellomyces punctatus DAOM BR117]|uniref:Bromo domain-containing protein n=1 Tax=Spizellomyces punctatus (strain DAOM BR117) TaxID=645134 RepID=A0A0L0HEX2_SPIPD|nr:uncharacterized protein SPPG_05568 [Spizellomyces punctatus DAOM BR117]KNC99318.1 hypothetical protein SPPG_05568 [Spizellomyces punctatus DAOM BR117]|eukprot:XP_016607358.1 hypothetical protein SPPG_05568 [Spizellomyces punctatus DAOM BR117]